MVCIYPDLIIAAAIDTHNCRVGLVGEFFVSFFWFHEYDLTILRVRGSEREAHVQRTCILALDQELPECSQGPGSFTVVGKSEVRSIPREYGVHLEP